MPRFLKKKYPLCFERKRLDSSIAIVTGSNTGIGLETVAELARRGCTVIMASRSMERLHEAKAIILDRYSSEKGLSVNLPADYIKEDISIVKPEQLVPMLLDLSSFETIEKFIFNFTSQYQKLDLLICNAGVMMCPYAQTEEGYEMQMGTNHIGHYLLTELLTPLLNFTNGRVIIVSSAAHYHGSIDANNFLMSADRYNSTKAYMNSKLANVCYARYLGKKFGLTGPLAVSLHPGVVKTDLGRHMSVHFQRFFLGAGYCFIKNAWQGAQTTLFCALAPREKLVNGAYYSDCQLKRPKSIVEDEEILETFIKRTYDIVSQTKAGSALYSNS